MIGVYDSRQEKHIPLTRLSGGFLVPSPEKPERLTMLRSGLEMAGISLINPIDHGLSAIKKIHDSDYLSFLEHGFKAWSNNPANGPEMRASVHPNKYMQRKPADLLGRAGYFQADASCILMENSWEAICASANTAIDAMKRVLEGKDQAYALCRPPGHHAYTDMAGGFCYLNNTAIAANLAAMQGLKVAIIDVDVHHGNGTQAIFYDRADVFTLSIHGDPSHLYPYYAGYEDERGRETGIGYNLNIPVALFSDDEAYCAALEKGLEQVQSFTPDIVVVALGLDAAASDPFACMNVSPDGFHRMGQLLKDAAPKTLIVQEGGYPSGELALLLQAFLTGIMR